MCIKKFFYVKLNITKKILVPLLESSIYVWSYLSGTDPGLNMGFKVSGAPLTDAMYVVSECTEKNVNKNYANNYVNKTKTQK